MSHIRRPVSAVPTIWRPLSHNAAVRRYHTTRDALTRAHRWQCVTRRDATRRDVLARRPASSSPTLIQGVARSPTRSPFRHRPFRRTDSLCNSKGLCALLMGYFTSIYSLRKVGATTYNRSWSFFVYKLLKFYLNFSIFLELKLGCILFWHCVYKRGNREALWYIWYIFPRRSRSQ